MAHQDFSHLQDVMGSLPMLKRYIVICLAFTLDEANSSRSQVKCCLQQALDRFAKTFPFLAGQVVMEGRGEARSGLPKVIPLHDHIQLYVKDLREEAGFPSMQQMREAQYPFSMLDCGVLAPSIASRWSSEGFERVAPVLLLQANFIRGGLLLTFAGNHMMMDMTGLGLTISLFSKACRAEPFTHEEIQQGNQPRGNAVPLLGDKYQPGPELEDSFVKPRAIEEKNNPSSPSDHATTLQHPPSPPRWVYFNFTAARLAKLKQQASQQTVAPYVSTDDAVGALCWQSVSRARVARLGTAVRTVFARPISARKYLGLQGYYLGHMVDMVYEDEEDVWSHPLGEIAGRLRRLLLQDDMIAHHTRAFATMLYRLADKTQLVNGARLDLDRDIVFSSYANIRCCELEFGPTLGVPNAARRPRMEAWPSLLYMMPKSTAGDIAVAFCVSEDDLAMLRQDETFMSYADYIG
ncbi:uncharacterized protein A1O9_08772 [Exophiala aquamarina CBS 119918]|uniref:Trichothecene 3-O-acetyltransferase-like N-terminal domain-containing protein n=1 Tax=Exophiala aquamarina CBS 119918 TaxID=1182545 RepID=A0A072P4S6_9EURO|nr:uncharacterized protein A1O9_08772 [Exophiala aquamarina CBS 119918]KEF55119.1 hypothetical protein A1O9_08772 [Exophiala aquamarina CBS 119918]